jgi:hypothetical protein
VAAAEAYDAQGADELTFLDITASSDRRNIILDVVARTAERVFMPLTVGGGIREVADIRNLLNAGADKVSVNTAAVKRHRVRPRSRGAFRFPVHRGGPRRPPGAGLRTAAMGDLHTTAAAPRPASTPCIGH